MAHPVRPQSYMEISNFYTATVYEKGAEVVRMIHTLIGAENFRKGMDLYFERHDGQAVRTDDFVQAMEDASGVDLTQFKRWYDQAGTPTARRDRRITMRRPALHADRQSIVPADARPTRQKRRFTSRSRSASSGPTAATFRCSWRVKRKPTAARASCRSPNPSSASCS